MEHIEMVDVKIVIGLLSILGLLVGLIWNSHAKQISDVCVRLRDVELVQKTRPFPQIESSLSEIKTDIKWIKGYLFNEISNK